MTAFSIYPPEPKELFFVIGTEEYEGLVFAQCTSVDLARSAVLMIEGAGITSTKIIKDTLGINRVRLGDQCIEIPKTEIEYSDSIETPMTEEQWNTAKAKAMEDNENWDTLKLAEKEALIYSAHNQLLQQIYGMKK